MGEYKIGQTVLSKEGRQGIIRFIGTGSFAVGEWIGLELPDDSGKNDGTVRGERYFDCPPGRGIFIRKAAVEKIIEEPTASAKARAPMKPANGAARPRPSSGITAEQARKRQSLMGSGSTVGSRMSLRSPTKSLTKTAHSSASSTTSTPRTGTPATTNRTSDSSAKSRLSVNGRSAMAPPVTPRATTHASRPSIGGAPPKAMRSSTITQRQSLGGPVVSNRREPSASKEPLQSDADAVREPPMSPTIAEEEAESEDISNLNDHLDRHSDDASEAESIESSAAPVEDSMNSALPGKQAPRTANLSRNNSNGNLNPRAIAQREVETLKGEIDLLKSKLRIMEKKRLEDRDKMKTFDKVQADKERFENIIQALQKKLKSSQQEMTELRNKCLEAELRAGEVDNKSGEHESELELAMINKEMADERAEAFQAELESLKVKHEELELEAEILREENKELGSVMSSEEKASAGWLQMERERERLREALIALRDMSQQTESDLRSQIRELHDDLSESEQLKSKFQQTNERLIKSESTIKHLMEQLEAAESNEDVALALEQEKESNLKQIELLRQKVQELEEEVQVNDDLEAYHVSAEKELQHQLDETEALLHEKQYQNNEQATTLADFEYTLTKFRDVVSALQGDIDDLRRSKDISEFEAHEMSSKSRAMLDLNLQLQNSAAKTQMKAIDVELGKIRAEESSQHLEIVQMFVYDSFDAEKNPILALLCVKRIRAKAMLVAGVLRDRMKDRPHLMQDEPFMAFEIMEDLSWIATCCDRFIRFISSCDVAAFSKLNNMMFDLEPVERAINGWIEALRRDEMSKEGPKHLARMIGILSDLAEKVIGETFESKATELFANTTMVESYCDSIASQTNVIAKVVQRRLGPPTEDNEESLHFDKKMDQFCTKARTTRFLAGKVIQSLEETRSRSMGLGESAWTAFEEAEAAGKELCQIVRQAGMTLLDDIAKDEHDELMTYAYIADLLTKAIMSCMNSPPMTKDDQSDDFFAILNYKLQKLHSKVEEMHSKAQDITTTSEFERAPAPWTIQAREIKSQKIISPDVQEELSRLKTRVQEQLSGIAGKDRQLEEQHIKIELLESRTKETKIHSETLHKLEDEIKALKSANEAAERELEDAKNEHRALQQKHDDAGLELNALRQAGTVTDGVVTGMPDHTALLELRADNALLKSEIESLQAAVRWLKGEVHRGKVPVSMAASLAKEHAWLDPRTLGKTTRDDTRPNQIKREANEVYDRLVELAATARPVMLKPSAKVDESGRAAGKKSVWRSMHDMPRYQMLRQREEIERWEDMRAELVRSVRLSARTKTRTARLYWQGDNQKSKSSMASVHVRRDGVEIVSSSP